MPTLIPPKDAVQRNGCCLLDVRTPAEFAAVHAVGAVNVPLDRLDPSQVKDLAKGNDLLVICHTDNRARVAAEKLEASGLRCQVVEGGTKAWVAANLPVNRTERMVLSLDRQVQLVIGPLILGGTLLAWQTGDVRWMILPGFIGTGLIVAGTTGFCGLAYVLGRMPWNAARKSTTPSCCGG